jgi:hypothetical protein
MHGAACMLQLWWEATQGAAADSWPATFRPTTLHQLVPRHAYHLQNMQAHCKTPCINHANICTLPVNAVHHVRTSCESGNAKLCMHCMCRVLVNSLTRHRACLCTRACFVVHKANGHKLGVHQGYRSQTPAPPAKTHATAQEHSPHNIRTGQRCQPAIVRSSTQLPGPRQSELEQLMTMNAP